MRKDGDQWSVKVRGIEMRFKLEGDRVYYKYGDDEWNLSPVHRDENDLKFRTPMARQTINIHSQNQSKSKEEREEQYLKNKEYIDKRLDVLQKRSEHGYYRGYAEEKEQAKTGIVKTAFKEVNRTVMETLNVTKDQIILASIWTVAGVLILAFGYIFMNGI